jgi:hypothetical protein
MDFVTDIIYLLNAYNRIPQFLGVVLNETWPLRLKMLQTNMNGPKTCSSLTLRGKERLTTTNNSTKTIGISHLYAPIFMNKI